MDSASATKAWTTAELRERLEAYESELRQAGLRRNTINTYVQHPERFIAWLDDRYSPRGPIEVDSTAPSQPRSKYQPLAEYLTRGSRSSIRMSFEEIERVLGFELPASAGRHRAWWANETSGNHSHAAGWMGAGYETADVDLRHGLVTFRRS